MSLIRYNASPLLGELHSEINKLFADSSLSDSSKVETGAWLTPVDIQESPENFVLHMDVPGVDSNSIEVSMEENVLTLQGERSRSQVHQEANYTRTERECGSFYRRFNLPDTAEGEKISAKAQQGVLEVIIPKKVVEKPKKIQVSVE